VDWVLALEGGFISPKSGLEAGAEERPFFDYDVKLVQEGWELFSVTFPHGSHTRWLGCDNCHPQIFEMRQGAAPITMDAIGAGEYCGRCHGAVAFPVPTGCPRCHRQTGEDVGSILSALVSATQTGRTPSVRTAVNVRGTIVFERSERQQDFPPATFPHWVHRIQFRCDVCHTRIFPMQAGASRITMDAILQGKLCGTCHNGTTAFPARFDTCYRCHTQP
jgi:c(7)-type cytochrome triheme protein